MKKKDTKETSVKKPARIFQRLIPRKSLRTLMSSHSTGLARQSLRLATAVVTLALGQIAAADVQESSVQGYTGSGVRGYTGSGVRGYTGSGVRGYTGSGVRGYTGSGVRGYTGSGVRGYTGSGVRGYTGSGVRGFAGDFAVAAMGPVESVNIDGDAATLVVLGQTFVTNAAVGASFSVGDYVVAASDGGDDAAVVYGLEMPYVPGVSEIRLKGPVLSANRGLATAVVGSASLDYSAQLSIEPDMAPLSGDSLEVVGIQPVLGGLVIVGSGNGNALVGRQ